MEKAKREREILKKFYVSENEELMINEKMAQVGTNNFSMYARKMCIDGYIIKRDFTELRTLSRELAAIGRNINQIAKHANETNVIYKEDIEDLRRDFFDIKSKISERLVKIIRED